MIKERWQRFKWPNGVGQGYGQGYMRLVPKYVRRHGNWGGLVRYAVAYPWLIRYVAWRYLDNCWMDFMARLGGRCNSFLLKGGYAHWRCLRRASHPGLHRAINYTWYGVGPPNYDPIPIDAYVHADKPNRQRHMVRNFRQRRAWQAQLREHASGRG